MTVKNRYYPIRRMCATCKECETEYPYVSYCRACRIRRTPSGDVLKARRLAQGQARLAQWMAEKTRP